jgi:hypothetical protein
MEPNELPLWLLGIQAVTWLATGDAALTAQARPSPAGHKLGGHPDAIPVEGWKPLTERIEVKRRGLEKQYLEYTGAIPHAEESEPLSQAQRPQVAGEPSQWGGGFLEYLRMRTGDIESHIERLVEAARAGKVATVDAEDNSIASSVWNRHSLRETLWRPGVLIMVPDPFHQIDEDTAVEPQFKRDDVFRLGTAAKPSSATPLGCVSNTAEPTPDAVAEFIKRRRDELSASSKKHGRDVLIAEAVRHFGVQDKYARGIWKSKGLGKKLSTSKGR